MLSNEMLLIRQQKVKDKTIKISCVVPTYNEEKGILSFLHALNQALKAQSQHYEIVVVDDGSTDKTASLVAYSSQMTNIKLLKLSRNFGKEAALTAGIEHANGEVVLLIDSDFQHPFELIPTFIKHWSEGYDMIYGIRQNRNHETWLKRCFTKGFYAFMKKLTCVHIVANAGDFRLFDQNVAKALLQCEERGRFMKGLYAWAGFKHIGIPFEVQARASGSTSWKKRHLVELALTGITAFSNIPLRIWSVIGFLISSLSFIYALFIIIKTLRFGIDVPGYSSLMVAVMFFGGVQLLSIGVLGEYIARIFNEVKKRPIYIIDQIIYPAGGKNPNNI